TFSADLRLLMHRHDYPEETYFTFSYSPIRDESGGVGGAFCAVFETTERVLGERRLGTLRDLGAATAEPDSPEDACRPAVAILARKVADVPTFRCCLCEDGGPAAHLVASAGTMAGDATAPSTVDIHAGVPATQRSVVLPLGDADGDTPAGLLVVGLNPNRP